MPYLASPDNNYGMQTFRTWVEHVSLSHEAQITFKTVFDAAVLIAQHMKELKGKQEVPKDEVYGIADAAQKIYSALSNMRDTTVKDLEQAQHLESLANRVYYAMKNIDMIVSDMKSNPERYGDMATYAVSRLGGNGYNQTTRVAGTGDQNHLKDMYTELMQIRQKLRAAYDKLFSD